MLQLFQRQLVLSLQLRLLPIHHFKIRSKNTKLFEQFQHFQRFTLFFEILDSALDRICGVFERLSDRLHPCAEMCF